MHTILYDGSERGLRGLSANDILFQVQSGMILELAKKDNCVFIGRCADYVLDEAGIPNVSLFITAPFSDRVNRKMALLSLDEKTTVALVRKNDRQRKNYYNYYTGASWGKAHNYDICLNSFALGLDRTVESLVRMAPVLQEMYGQENGVGKER